MSLVISEKGGGGFAPIPAGTYIAVCCMMVDEGTQKNEKFGNEQQKVRIGFEIPELTIEIDGELKPRMISREYTNSLNQKATLRKELESWRGKAFTLEELKGFDLKKIAGAPCMLSVIHYDGTDGNKRAKISGIMAMPGGIPKPKLSEPPTVFEMTDDPEEWIPKLDSLPEWVRNIVKASNEYQAYHLEPPEFTEEPLDESEDDLPF